MSPFEILSLASLALGSASVLRFVWLDSLRFRDVDLESEDPTLLSPRTVERISLQADAIRVAAETENLQKAA